jgi:hypothetical protein
MIPGIVSAGMRRPSVVLGWTQPGFTSNAQAYVQPMMDAAKSTAGWYSSNGGRTVYSLTTARVCRVNRTRPGTVGKVYWEVDVHALSNNGQIGYMDDAAPTPTGGVVTRASSFGIGPVGGISHRTPGNVQVNGATFGSIDGKTLGFALEYATGKYWVAYDGVWQGGGNPATGANPAGTIGAITTAGQPAIYGDGSFNLGFLATFAMRASEFKFAVPAGFTAFVEDEGPSATVTAQRSDTKGLASADYTTTADTASPAAASETATTWSTEEKSEAMTLSAGNLVATATGSGQIAKAAGYRRSGKWYWEVVTSSSAAGSIMGLAGPFSPLNAVLASSNTLDCGAIGMRKDGSRVRQNVTVAGVFGAGWVDGDVLMFAGDFDKGLFWAGKNGAWLGVGADPATGLNGQPFSVRDGAAPAGSPGTGGSMQGRFLASSQAYAAPAGFAAWGNVRSRGNYLDKAGTLSLADGEASKSIVVDVLPKIAQWDQANSDSRSYMFTDNGRAICDNDYGSLVNPKVRSTLPKAGGKWYAEMFQESNSSYAPTAYNLGIILPSGKRYGISPAGVIFEDDVSTGVSTGVTYDVNGTGYFRIGVDVAGGKVWFGSDDSNWGGGDPATGAGAHLSGLALAGVKLYRGGGINAAGGAILGIREKLWLRSTTADIYPASPNARIAGSVPAGFTPWAEEDLQFTVDFTNPVNVSLNPASTTVTV